MNIRPACPDDASALAGLLGELGFPVTVGEVTARLDALSTASELVLVAVEGEDPVGLAAVHITPVLHRPTPVGRITALVVTERMRGQGVGRALVEAAEGLVGERGCALIELTSNRALAEAHRFYEGLGYEATSFRFKKPLAIARASGV